MITDWKDANGADVDERVLPDGRRLTVDRCRDCAGWYGLIDGTRYRHMETREAVIAAVEKAAGVVETQSRAYLVNAAGLPEGASLFDAFKYPPQTPLEASVARDAPGPTPRAGWDDGHIAHIVADADALRAQVQALTEELAKAHASHEEWIGIIGKEQDQHRAALRDARALAYRLVRVATRKGTIDEPEIADIEAALAFGPEGTK